MSSIKRENEITNYNVTPCLAAEGTPFRCVKREKLKKQQFSLVLSVISTTFAGDFNKDNDFSRRIKG